MLTKHVSALSHAPVQMPRQSDTIEGIRGLNTNSCPPPQSQQVASLDRHVMSAMNILQGPVRTKRYIQIVGGIQANVLIVFKRSDVQRMLSPIRTLKCKKTNSRRLSKLTNDTLSPLDTTEQRGFKQTLISGTVEATTHTSQVLLLWLSSADWNSSSDSGGGHSTQRVHASHLCSS